MLISQPGSDYQLAEVALDAGHARDIMLMLLDVHAVLDQLDLDGTQPQITATAVDHGQAPANASGSSAALGGRRAREALAAGTSADKQRHRGPGGRVPTAQGSQVSRSPDRPGEYGQACLPPAARRSARHW